MGNNGGIHRLLGISRSGQMYTVGYVCGRNFGFTKIFHLPENNMYACIMYILIQYKD
jgi:pimeloyl-CoA synthetase